MDKTYMLILVTTDL